MDKTKDNWLVNEDESLSIFLNDFVQELAQIIKMWNIVNRNTHTLPGG